MKKIVMFCLIVFCLGSIVNAQDYKTGIGLRAGPYYGLTIKHFISTKAAIEGIIASRWRGLAITGLYEVHNQAFDTERLKWYIGFGGHVGFWNRTYTNWGPQPNPGDPNYTVVGIDGVLGLEYSFTEVPINIGLDWKPAFDLVGYSGFWADGGALSIRYIF